MASSRRAPRLWWSSGERDAAPDSSGESVIGKLAQVVVRVPGPGRPGEVLVQIRGGSEAFIAYSDQEIPVGVAVVVVAARGGRSVEVTPFGS